MNPYQPQDYPRKAVTRRPMPLSLELFHWTMILCTAGLWIPVYLAAKRARKTTTTWK